MAAARKKAVKAKATSRGKTTQRKAKSVEAKPRARKPIGDVASAGANLVASGYIRPVRELAHPLAAPLFWDPTAHALALKDCDPLIQGGAPVEHLTAALTGDYEAAIYAAANALRSFRPVRQEHLLDTVAFARAAGLAVPGIDRAFESALYNAAKRSKFSSKPALAIRALGLGRYADVPQLWPAAKLSKSAAIDAMFFSPAKFIGYLAAACEHGASPAEVRPAWEMFIDTIPLWSQGRMLDPDHPAIVLSYVGRAYYVGIEKAPLEAVVERVRADVASRLLSPCSLASGPCLADRQHGRPGRFEALWLEHGERLRVLLEQNKLRLEMDRKYTYLSLNRRIATRIEDALLATFLFGPRATRSHLAVIAVQLVEEMGHLKGKVVARKEHVLDAVTLLALGRLSGGPFAPESYYIGDEWLDLDYFARRYVNERKRLDTLSVVHVALRGTDAYKRWFKAQPWEREERVTPLVEAIDRGDQDACLALLDECLREASFDARMVWTIWAIVVRGLGKPVNEAMDFVHERLLSLVPA